MDIFSKATITLKEYNITELQSFVKETYTMSEISKDEEKIKWETIRLAGLKMLQQKMKDFLKMVEVEE